MLRNPAATDISSPTSVMHALGYRWPLRQTIEILRKPQVLSHGFCTSLSTGNTFSHFYLERNLVHHALRTNLSYYPQAKNDFYIFK